MSTARIQHSPLILANGRIHAEPDGGRPADAMLVAGGVVQGLGTVAEIVAAAGPGVPVVNLAGRTVLPAFIESHTHFHRAAVLARCHIDFEALRPSSIDDVLAAVSIRAASLPAGAWVQGDGLSPSRLVEGRLPERRALDTAAGGRPVVLRGIGKHVVAASTAALAAAGIDAATADPPGGRIDREPDGAPSGILHEQAKLRLDQSHPATVVPAPAAAERRAALRSGIAELHRLGVATLHEMVRLPEEAGDWAELHQSGGLDVRIRLFYRVHESALDLGWLESLGIRRGLGDDWLRVLGVKVSVDGFCIFRNAAVHEPYWGQPENLGLLRIDQQRLEDLVARSNAQGLQVAVHAVGARAVDNALTAFEHAGPSLAGPYRLEHGYVDMDAPRIARMRALDVAWSVQPAFRVAYEREWLDAFGPERRARLMPLAAGDAAGLRMLFNSDTPCAPVDPLGGIRAATDPSLPPGSRVSRRAAWRAWTSTPAEVAGEPRLGRLSAGSLADLVVFDEDPLEESTDLATVRVRATMINGQIAHDEGGVFR